MTTGAIVGAVVFSALSIGMCADLDLPDGCYAFAIPIGALGGAFTFGSYGYLGSERVEYRLVE